MVAVQDRVATNRGTCSRTVELNIQIAIGTFEARSCPRLALWTLPWRHAVTLSRHYDEIGSAEALWRLQGEKVTASSTAAMAMAGTRALLGFPPIVYHYAGSSENGHGLWVTVIQC